jgi:hypothetical protein
MTACVVALFVAAMAQLPRADEGPQPDVVTSSPSTRAPNAAIETALHGYFKYKPDWYFYNHVDLNADAQPEVLVYVVGRWICGNEGCPLVVMKKNGTAYAVVSKIARGHIPVIVSHNRTNGWNDLLVWQHPYPWDSENGLEGNSYWAELSFDGKTYPFNPKVMPAKRLRRNISGDAYMLNPPSPEFGIPIG